MLLLFSCNPENGQGVPPVEEVLGVLNVEEAVCGQANLAFETVEHENALHRIGTPFRPSPLVSSVAKRTLEISREPPVALPCNPPE